jgi:hypothetical protein
MRPNPSVMTMRHPRLRPPTTTGTATGRIVPESQTRALDRRQALDQQQRSFRERLFQPHFKRPRPPG